MRWSLCSPGPTLRIAIVQPRMSISYTACDGTCSVHAVHMHCTCIAHAVHMQCTCSAHAVHSVQAVHMHTSPSAFISSKASMASGSSPSRTWPSKGVHGCGLSGVGAG